MSNTSLAAPQLVINSRMLYSSWIPADPKAAAALLPPGLRPADNHALYMNQYVVDSEAQTSSFGAYSLTYMGLDLAGRKAPDGVTPARFFTHYFNSSEVVRSYVRERGVPASPGTTTLELNNGELVATTRVDGVPIIRTVARVGSTISSVARGHLTYVTRVHGRFVAGNYPYVGELASPFELVSLEFLAKDHPTYALRPASPLQRVEGWCWYAPRDSFVYPGGEYDWKP
ncbi:hypothetical protein [Archangium lipolyticum]|uniref:hypothetical protein n=1 Tax=Archangium lipolyticum TaxID=2970465 RepID=UPI00214A5A53|nr:hypothetical protein [Archangium lipolyticum]